MTLSDTGVLVPNTDDDDGRMPLDWHVYGPDGVPVRLPESLEHLEGEASHVR